MKLEEKKILDSVRELLDCHEITFYNEIESIVLNSIRERENQIKNNLDKCKLLEIMNSHLEVREEFNHYHNSTDLYVDGKEETIEEILKLI